MLGGARFIICDPYSYYVYTTGRQMKKYVVNTRVFFFSILFRSPETFHIRCSLQPYFLTKQKKRVEALVYFCLFLVATRICICLFVVNTSRISIIIYIQKILSELLLLLYPRPPKRSQQKAATPVINAHWEK